MLTEKQQHSANRHAISSLLYLGMDRTKARQQKRQAAFAGLRTRFKSNVEFSDVLGDGFSPSYVSQLLNGIRGIGDDVATKIEARLNLPSGYLDREDDTLTPDDVARAFEQGSDGKRDAITLLARLPDAEAEAILPLIRSILSKYE